METAKEIFNKERNMLASLEYVISPEIGKYIKSKIDREEELFVSFIIEEENSRNKESEQSKSAIDDRYFSKKDFNINNL